MRKPTSRRRMRVAVGSVLVVAIGAGMAGAASAYWSGAGSGTGTGTSAQVVAVTLSSGSAPATLYPGGQADVVLTAINPNASSVAIRRLIADTSRGSGGFAVDTGHPGCVLSALSFAPQTNDGAGWAIAGASGGTDGRTPITLVDALSMDPDAALACQGATFTVYLTAAG